MSLHFTQCPGPARKAGTTRTGQGVCWSTTSPPAWKLPGTIHLRQGSRHSLSAPTTRPELPLCHTSLGAEYRLKELAVGCRHRQHSQRTQDAVSCDAGCLWRTRAEKYRSKTHGSEAIGARPPGDLVIDWGRAASGTSHATHPTHPPTPPCSHAPSHP